MDPRLENTLHQTRRHFLRDSSLGLGAIALSLLDNRSADAFPAQANNPMAPRAPHFAPKATNVIYLHMAGSPPHLDLFDYKPELVRRNGQNCPDEFLRGRRFAFTSGVPKLLGTPRRFAQHGQCGAWVSDAMPQIATLTDELCFIKSMFTDQINHAPAEPLLFIGSPFFCR